MKLAATISRYLLGLMFVVFGLNGFLHFIPQQMPTNPLAAQFLTAGIASHYFVIVYLLQFVAGALLLSGRFVPLALALLAPVLVNILDYHLTMDPATIAPGIVVTILWILVFLNYRAAFAPLFRAQP
jgi:uncharacterized membrane protein YphA (DoxX/SURF4 family)